MKKTIMLLLSTAFCFPLGSYAAPEHNRPAPEFRGPVHHREPSPIFNPRPGHRVSILPELATTIAIGGITYWLVNGIYYQKQGTEYVVVEKPSGLQSLDFDGKRYYISDGHYYIRDINGNYTEVPRPPGL
ncbi:TPA: hypothetical protein IGZ65_004978 [Escherichia coli]|nr:hypothetical protein [Escherichia coli]